MGLEVNVVFGVETDDLEQARAWVEKATGLSLEEREHHDLGGQYYAIEMKDESELLVVTNIDVYDGKPLTEAPAEWSIAVLLSLTGETQKVFEDLRKVGDQFVLVHSDELGHAQ